MTYAKYSTVAKYNYAGFETSGSLTNNDHRLGSAFTFVKKAAACTVSEDLTTNSPTGCFDTEARQRWFSANEGTTGIQDALAVKNNYDTLRLSFNT